MFKTITSAGQRLEYWGMRTLRRVTPQGVVDLLLDTGIYLKPGLDTSRPDLVAQRYASRAASLGLSVRDAAVCVVGFGGSVGIGIHLLELGARSVVLQDPFAPVRPRRNRAIDAELQERYLYPDGSLRDSRLSIVRDPLGALAAGSPDSMDLVVSNSVLEHVADLDDLARASRGLLRSGGAGIHNVDLRDHYFRYPFEMLCYDQHTWSRWLNASNNLNRLRIPDYQGIFSAHFEDVSIEVAEWLRDEFDAARPRIRPEFLSGDDDIDAAARFWLETR